MAVKQKAASIQASGIGMSYLPMDPKWIQEHPCFFSADPALVRASLNMLVAAWRNAPDVSIPASYSALAFVAGLDEKKLAENFADISCGWELRDGRLVHVEMKAFCDALWARHGQAFAQFAVDTAAVAQAPEDFELATQEAVAKRTKGRRLLPKQWAPSNETRMKIEAMGFDSEAIDSIVEKMRNWSESTGQMRNSWDATLLIFASREPAPTSKGGLVPFVPSRFGSLVHKGEAARSANQSAMALARQERQ